LRIDGRGFLIADVKMRIRQRKKDERPFLIYLNTYIPHTPYTLPDEGWDFGYKRVRLKGRGRSEECQSCRLRFAGPGETGVPWRGRTELPFLTPCIPRNSA